MAGPVFDPTLAADLFERFAEPLATRLSRRYRGVDSQVIEDAVIEAILVAARTGADSSEAAMYRHARGRLRIQLRSETRRRNREKNSVTNPRPVAPSPADEVDIRELAAALRPRIAHTDVEIRALDLWLAGVVTPVELAQKLGLEPSEIVTLLARFRQRIRRERERQTGTRDGTREERTP